MKKGTNGSSHAECKTSTCNYVFQMRCRILGEVRHVWHSDMAMQKLAHDNLITTFFKSGSPYVSFQNAYYTFCSHKCFYIIFALLLVQHNFPVTSTKHFLVVVVVVVVLVFHASISLSCNDDITLFFTLYSI